MKKYILIFIAILMSIILTACGMSQEQIAESMTNLDNAYQTGTYEQAKNELNKLDKAYNKMSDEQKNKFGELRPLVENAVANVSAIQETLNNVQSFYDQKMYYEAQAELDKLMEYQLPPTEKTKCDELQGNVGSAIKTWKITEGLQNIEALYNSGDYDLASTTINGLDISAANEEQKQRYDSLKGKIDNSRLLVQAEGEYNKGKYTTSLNTLSTVNTAYLTADQNQKYNSLKSNAEAAKKRSEGISESQAKSIAMNYYSSQGCQSVQCYGQDRQYYYIRAFMGANYTFVIGECLVFKENGVVTPLY